MPPASNKPHSAGKYSGLASNLAHLGRMRLSPGLGAAARWQMMLQVEQGGQQLTSERRVHPLRTDASSGVGNSSAQTVDAHVPREWEEPASEALREGWSEAEVCAEEVAAPREPMRGRFSAEAPPASSRSSYRQGQRKAPSGSNSTAQSKAPSGRATCRTSSIGKRMFWQIMVPKGQVLRG